MDVESLKGIPFFSQLSARERKLVAQHADEIDLGPGTHLADTGRVAQELFVIVTGTADVFDGEQKINEVGPGDVIGEIGLLKTTRRIATVVTTSSLRAIVMYGPELKALNESAPQLFTQLEALVEERLRRNAEGT